MSIQTVSANGESILRKLKYKLILASKFEQNQFVHLKGSPLLLSSELLRCQGRQSP